MDDRRDLRPLFDPASVAVVGASDDPQKWGNWLARGALEGEHRRSVYLVNRRVDTVLSRKAYRSLEALPSAPELVVLCVPASSLESAVDEALDKGTKAIVGITAGLAEVGAEGRALEESIAKRVRDAGAVLVGPNCLGLSDSASELQLASNELPAGPIGLVSQSGNLALELGIKARRAGLGFARFVSVGNQADLEVADFVTEFAESPGIEVIAAYCEDFRDGRRFVEAAGRATALGRPVVLLTVGTSGAAVRAARSHTGALVSGASSIEAACRAAGIERVGTPQELIDTAEALLMGILPAGRRVGVVADGGGHGAIAADVTEAHELAVPTFSEGLSSLLSEATGTPGGTSNPVDLAGAGEQDIFSFKRVVSTLVSSDEVDAVLLTGYFGGYGHYSPEAALAESAVAEALVGLVRQSGKPMVVHAMHQGDPESERSNGPDGPLGLLRAKGIPVCPSVEDAARMLARLARRRENLDELAATSAPVRAGSSAPAAAQGAAPATRGAAPAAVQGAAPAAAQGARGPASAEAEPEHLEGPSEGGYFAARELLTAYGFPLGEARRATSLEELAKAAAELGFPLVLKAAELEHKSDAGGVVLGLETDAQLAEAAETLWARFPASPLSVEPMLSVKDGVELLVGVVRDPRFGPVALVGLGGIYAEALSDTAVGLAPIGPRQAERLVESLRGAVLLRGARGRLAVDVGAAARALSLLSEVAWRHPEVQEVEVNPLVVWPGGACGLDARLVVAGKTGRAEKAGDKGGQLGDSTSKP